MCAHGVGVSKRELERSRDSIMQLIALQPKLPHTHTCTHIHTYQDMEALEPDFYNDPEPLDLTFAMEEVQF